MELVEGEFHEGEEWMQTQSFGAKRAAEYRKNIRSMIRVFMPEQHQIFFQESPWLIVGTVDSTGFPHASFLVQPGFKSLKRGRGFSLADVNSSQFRGDTVAENLSRPGAALGILGIQLSTRRRNRVNAKVVNITEEDGHTSSVLRVEQSFGNCPKYIQARGMKVLSSAESIKQRWGEYKVEEGLKLEGYAREIVEKADTFFVATVSRGELQRQEEQKEEPYDEYTTWKVPQKASSEGVDVSHRGGSPGFVKVEDEGAAFRWPDFVGNGMFNTLGNIQTNPNVSVLMIDFEKGAILQMKGVATVKLGDTQLPGGVRTVKVKLVSYKITFGALPLEFDVVPEASPFNPGLEGDGDELEYLGNTVETHDTKSFYFRSKRPMFMSPGQYGTFSIVQGGKELAKRAWTLSSTPKDTVFGVQEFSITVKHKKGGEVSPVLHSADNPLGEGKLQLRLINVTGDFILPEEVTKQDRFAFIAAGSGITPAMSILRRLSQNGVHATLVYSVQKKEDIIFEDQIIALSKLKLDVHIAFTKETQESLSGMRDLGNVKVSAGRITRPFIVEALGERQYNTAYICGPGGFARVAQDTVDKTMQNVEKVVVESFDF